jgi:hypothetical protein
LPPQTQHPPTPRHRTLVGTAGRSFWGTGARSPTPCPVP